MGTHREGEGVRLLRFCGGGCFPVVDPLVGKRGDMELLPREDEEHDDTEETDPLFPPDEPKGLPCASDLSGEVEVGDGRGEVSSDSDDDLGGEQAVMFTGLRAQRLTCRLRFEATPNRRPQISQTKA